MSDGYGSPLGQDSAVKATRIVVDSMRLLVRITLPAVRDMGMASNPTAIWSYTISPE